MIDLIATTRGGPRLASIQGLFDSLHHQTSMQFRLILVDQSADPQIQELCSCTRAFPVLRIPAEPCSLSVARNIGIRHRTAELVGFPDDDSVYETDTIARVLTFFGHHAARGVVGVVRELDGTAAVGHRRDHLPRTGLRVSASNVFDVATSHSFFMRWDPALAFDERLGVGTRNSSGEETDLILECIHRGWVFVCDETVRVRHPGMPTIDVPIQKIALYARGLGACVRKAVASRGQWQTTLPLATVIMRSLGGALLSRKTALRRRYWLRAWMAMVGFAMPLGKAHSNHQKMAA